MKLLLDEVIVDDEVVTEPVTYDELLETTDLDTKIIIIQDKLAKTISLKDLFGEIYNGLINKDKIKAISEHAEEVLQKTSLESYTDALTTVGYNESEKICKVRIAKEEQELNDLISTFIHEDAAKARTLLVKLMESDLVSFRDLLSDMSLLAINTIEDMSASKETIVPITGDETTEFKDIMTISLVGLDVNTLSSNKLTDKEGLDSNLKAIIEIIDSSSYFRTIFFKAVDKKDISLTHVVAELADYVDRDITMYDVLRFLGSESVRTFTDSLERELTTLIVAIDDFKTNPDVELIATIMTSVQNLAIFRYNTPRLSLVVKDALSQLLLLLLK